VYDVDEAQAALTMEFLEGQRLREALERADARGRADGQLADGSTAME
jgi:tRNA A-37 threonylcarbamoyl transferase component Bud32